MAGANWYRDGTVTATNGSKDVLGAEERLAEHERKLMEENGTTYLCCGVDRRGKGPGG